MSHSLRPVTDVTVTSSTSTSFTISWTPPVVDSTDTYLSYLFRVRPTGDTDWSVYPTTGGFTNFTKDSPITSFTFSGGQFEGAPREFDFQVLAQTSSMSATQSVTLPDLPP